MSSLVINSKIWGEMFGTREMSDIFSDKKTIQYYLEVEAALARVQSRLGIIPKTCGLEISKVAKTYWIDWKLLEKKYLMMVSHMQELALELMSPVQLCKQQMICQ